MEQLINNLEDLQIALKRVQTPIVYTNTQLDIMNINMFLDELEVKFPEQVQCIRELLDTMEE